MMGNIKFVKNRTIVEQIVRKSADKGIESYRR